MKKFALLALVIFIGTGLALALTSLPVPAVDEAMLPTENVVVRAYFDDRQMVYDLAAWKEPWEVDYDAGYLVVDVTPSEYDQLLAAGFRLEIDEKLTAQMNAPHVMAPGQTTGIPGFACYRTVEETFATAADIAANYPQLATWIDVGDSWEKTEPGGSPGYDMMVLRLTNSAVPGPKPKLFIMTSVHAREYTPAELNTRFAEYLVGNYDVDADVTWLLDYYEIHLMLQANPDGRKQAETGLSWRKNTNENYCSPTSTSRGADLNRNFEFQWGCCGGSSGSECSETYRGPLAASEPETQAIQAYVRSEFPDQRGDGLNDAAPDDAMGIFLDIHSYSQLVLWPWGFTSTVAPNGTALQTLGRKFAYFNGYEPDQAIGLYPTDGTTDDFAYGDLGLAAYTFELGTAFFQDCGTFENTILPDNMEALIYAAKTTGTPYMTPAGPDALNLALDTYALAPGDAVTMTVTLNDTRYNNQNGTEPTQNIAAAEYAIDTPFWITGTITNAMTAVDGSFNNPIESAQAVMDTSGLSTGRHIVFVRGQDAAGNWGAVSAEFFYVLDPATAPTIGGQVTALYSGQPLSATIQTDDIFRIATDPVSGVYEMLVISGTYEVTAVPNSPNYQPATATVVAYDNQTIQQGFTLEPYCIPFRDDVESGNIGWTADSPWAITDEDAYSGNYSWTDSPGEDYDNNRNVSLTSPPLDLTDYDGIELDFWHICDTESGYDYCYVEVSTNNGTTWSMVGSWDGNSNNWESVTLSLPQLDNQAQARIRFRLNTDYSVTKDGWHVDDVRLSAETGCVFATAPQAAFSSSSPDALGQETAFTNTSLGTDLNHLWDFGDGVTAVLENPTHTYASVGTYTVTLQVTNTLGVDVYTDTVDILLAPQAAFTSSSPDELGQTTVFTNTSTGSDLTFTWDFGDGSPVSNDINPTHAYAAAGTFTVTLTAQNAVGSHIATEQVTVISLIQPRVFLPVILAIEN